MKFKSGEHAHLAFNLLNQIDLFKKLDFPERVRLASKMEYRSFGSNEQILEQNKLINYFYIVNTGVIKLYRDVDFLTDEEGSIQIKQKNPKSKKTLRIEIDELSPATFYGEYEI